MQKMLIVVFSVLSIGMAKAQSSGGTPPYMQKSLSGESVQKVESETSGGNIAVVGVPAAEARIEVYVRNNHGNDMNREEAKKRLEEQYELIVSVTDHKLVATAKRRRDNDDWRNGLSVSFKIYVPEGSSTVLKTSGGNISLKKLSGTQLFKTSGGNLDLDQLSGKLIGKTSGGNIDISDSRDEIDLVTSGGNIEASHCEGNIRLGTSGGNLTLRLLKGTIRATTSGGSVNGEVIDGELSARTSGGNVRLRDLSCSLDAGTSAGNLDVSFKQLGKFITLNNSGGNISVALPQDKGLNLRVYAERVKINSMQNFKGETDEHHVEGTINGGGIPVKIDGSGGRTTLDFK